METHKDRITQYKRPENIQMSVFGNGEIFNINSLMSNAGAELAQNWENGGEMY